VGEYSAVKISLFFGLHFGAFFSSWLSLGQEKEFLPLFEKRVSKNSGTHLHKKGCNSSMQRQQRKKYL